jgi:hypothetical protein
MEKVIKNEYYLKNREKVIQNQVKKYQELATIFREWRTSLKCSKCGENDPACLEFHHCDPFEKETTITKMVARGFKSVIKELKKCIVVCSNCHSKIHAYDLKTQPDDSLSKKFEEYHKNKGVV